MLKNSRIKNVLVQIVLDLDIPILHDHCFDALVDFVVFMCGRLCLIPKSTPRLAPALVLPIMNRALQMVLFTVAILVAYVVMKPSPTEPVKFSLPSPPDLPYNSVLQDAEFLWKNRRLMRGPESLAVDPSGQFLYTGTVDGRIMRLNLRNPKGR